MKDFPSTTALTFGTPLLDTKAVLNQLPLTPAKGRESISSWKISREEEHVVLTLPLNEESRFYGLGEQTGEINRRSRRYYMNARDSFSYKESNSQLYGSHPVLLSTDPELELLFIDSPGKIEFDLGFTDPKRATITIYNPNFNLYRIQGDSFNEILKSFFELIGPAVIPPRWAFGFHQSKYSYKTEEEFREVADNFRKLNIPCDAVYFDIDYQDTYKCFTVNKEQFPNFPRLVNDLSVKGIKSVIIIDPFVRIEEDYEIYEEGLKGDHFCYKKDGSLYVGAVWPGYSHLPDFFQEKTQQWWADYHKKVVDWGVAGVWNDMNEPAIFYTPEDIKAALTPARELSEDFDVGANPIPFYAKLSGFFSNANVCDELVHTVNDKKVSHDLIHNLYGTKMAESTVSAIKKFIPNKRPFVLTRSTYIGAHRHSAVWTGDNTSIWEHLRENIQMLISMNLVGFKFVGADIGGYCDDTSPELMVRWFQLGIFSPYFRNHSNIGSRPQEPWMFGDEVTDQLREIVKLRYSLLTHIYSEYLDSVVNSAALIRGLFMDFSSKEAQVSSHQFLYGNSLMIAPVVQQGARGRFVYLPEDQWLMWKAKEWDETDCTIMEAGNHYIEATLEELPIFIRKNSMMVLHESQNFVNEKPIKNLKVVAFVTDEAEFVLYDDDGVSTINELSESQALRLKITVENGDASASVKRIGAGCRDLETVNFEVYTRDGKKTCLEVKPQ